MGRRPNPQDIPSLKGVKRPTSGGSKKSARTRTSRPMRDNDTRGSRGRSAESRFRRSMSKRAKIDHSPSRGHDFVLKYPNGRKSYVDVKEVNARVRSSKGRSEPGRVQVDREEVKRWVDWEKKGRRRSAWIVVAIRERVNKWRWKRARAKDVLKMIQDKKDPMKLTTEQIESMDDFEPSV